MAPPKPGPKGLGRRYDLDNLRNVLTTLVIIQHKAVAYGGAGFVKPHSELFDKSSPIVTPYVAINYAWGLGMFFWLSGNMTAMSLSKPGTGWEFIKGKLLRLGVPTLLYSLFLHPLQDLLLKPRSGGDLRSNLKRYLDAVRNFKLSSLAPGSVWYTATLLVFDLCALLIQRCYRLWSSGRRGSSEFVSLAKAYALLCRWGWLAVAGGSFLARTKFPLGKQLPVIHVNPSDLVQFVYAYALGHMAFHLGKPRMSSLFDKQSQPLGRLSVTKAIAVSLAAAPLVFLPGMLKGTKKSDEETKKSDEKTGKNDQSTKKAEPPKSGGFGGWDPTSALFSIWYELTFNTVAPATMSLFMDKYNHPNTQKLLSPRYAFAAYVLHSPFSWAFGKAVDTVLCPGAERPRWMTSRTWTNLGPVLMSGAVGMADVVASYGTGKLLIDNVPGAGTIL
ncbi:hypothetical protein PG996_004205 [Apiospora saccharicola]|uniref:Acyltransferase 3 domain-containing protein n=1 Tax=Apiospora saccharicola TaxID=335842 RepID=A0ABR1W6C1_9PEZI